jgi:hypothetical protein
MDELDGMYDDIQVGSFISTKMFQSISPFEDLTVLVIGIQRNTSYRQICSSRDMAVNKQALSQYLASHIRDQLFINGSVYSLLG